MIFRTRCVKRRTGCLTLCCDKLAPAVSCRALRRYAGEDSFGASLDGWAHQRETPPGKPEASCNGATILPADCLPGPVQGKLGGVARDEHDREDLLAEATALAERAELQVAGETDPVVVGFRRDGSASVYFGAEPAFHFNSAGELRRAFDRGLLYKAERRRLVSLARRRVADEVQLVRHELAKEATRAFFAELVDRFTRLRAALERGDCRLVGQVPASSDVVARIRLWLDNLALPPPVAASPRVGPPE